MSAYRSAQEASRDIFEFFINCPGFEGISLADVRLIEDRISVTTFYLAEKTRQLEQERLQRLNEHKLEICDGHVRNNLPSYGPGPDYELPTGLSHM